MRRSPQLKPGEIRTESELNGLYWQFSEADLAWMISCGSVCFLVFTVVQAPLPSLCSLAVVALTLYRLPESDERIPEGRIYMVVFDLVGNLWIRFVQKGVKWRSSEKQPYYNRLVYDVVEVTLEGKDEPIGLIRYAKDESFAALIKGDGWSPAARNLDEQAVALSTVAKKQQVAFNKRIGLSSIFHSRNYNPWPLRDFQAGALNPLVVYPPSDEEVNDASLPWATEEEQRRDRFLNSVVLSEQRDKDHVRHPIDAEVVYVGGNTDIAKALPRRKSKEGGSEPPPLSARLFARSPVVRAARLSALEWAASGLKNSRIATHKEVIEFLAATSSHDLSTFYDEEHENRTVAQHYMGYLPSQDVKVGRDYLVVDGTYIALVKAVKGREAVTPISYRRLRSVLDPEGHPINMTFAKLGVSTSSNLEQSWLSRWLALKDILVDQFMTSRRSTAYRLRQEEEEEREESLGRSQNRTHNYNIVAAVYAPDFETMEDWVTYLSDAFVGAGITPRRITGERSLLRYWRSLVGKNHA